MKYIVEAQTLIRIEVEAKSQDDAEEKARQELEELEGIDWTFCTHMPRCCKNCKFGVDYGESVEFIRCEAKDFYKAKRNKDVKKSDRCTLYEEAKT